MHTYNSFISPISDDYNNSVYYENPNYIFECYKAKKDVVILDVVKLFV